MQQVLIRLLETILDADFLSAVVRAIMGKFVIGLAVFWLVLLGLGVWIMRMRGK